MQIITTDNSITERSVTSEETNHRSLPIEVSDVVTRERMRLSSSDGWVLVQTPIVKRGHILNLVHTPVTPYTNSTTNNPYTTLALYEQFSKSH